MAVSGATARRRPRRRVVVAVVALVLAAGVLVWAVVRAGADVPATGPRAATGSHACGDPAGSAPSASGSSSVTSAPGTTSVDVRRAGAVGDGVTDDAPAIRRALASADTVHVPAGTYLLRSYDPSLSSPIDAAFVFGLRNGQTITADPGAVFKMADGIILDPAAAWGGNVFLAENVHDITITGLTLNLNGARNLVPAGRVITGYGLYSYASRHIVLTGVTMLDTPGQNYVVAQGGGDDIRVERSTFRNGGTSIPGNRNQTDFSALYFTATNVVVDRVTIEHDHAPFNFSGGVELHGSRESVTNSRIHNSWPAVYIGPDSHVGGDPQQHVVVACNIFADVGRGVVFNAGGTKAIDMVEILRNEITLRRYPAFQSEPTRAIDQDMPPGGEWTYHHIITALTIAQNRIDDADASSDAAIRLSQVHGAVIADNDLRPVAGAGLELDNSPWGTKNVTFERNRVDWLGNASAVALSLAGGSTRPPITAFTASNISVTYNAIKLLRPDRSSCAVYAAWNTAAGVSGVRFVGNTLSGISTEVCGPQGAQLQRAP